MKILTTILVTLLLSISAPLAAQKTGAENLTPSEKALIQNSYDGKLEIIQKLVKKGTSVNAADDNKRTALMWAALKNHVSVVEFLLGQGADINAKDSDNLTPLIYATQGSAEQTLEILLKKGPEVNVQSKKRGFTALMLAATIGNEKIVRMLLENGASAELKDHDGITAERFAREGGHSEVVDLLENQPSPSG